MSKENDSDGSISWEDFFGAPTELGSSLMGMYDALIARETTSTTTATASATASPTKRPPSASPAERPLSSASDSSSSGASSCPRGPKSSAYLASLESLEDECTKRPDRLPPSSTASQGSADSGVGSPWPRMNLHEGHHRYQHQHLLHSDSLGPRERVVQEIVNTEAIYVQDLGQIIQGYLDEWRNMNPPPFSESLLTDLFGNLEEIHEFNSAFLHELQSCRLDAALVAQAFVSFTEGFSVYTTYCTHYPRTVHVLTELMSQENTALIFRERQASLRHPLPLGSYLLKPVQRILKYHLLLQNLAKQGPHDAPGQSSVDEALSAMTDIAQHINNMKRRHEHAVRVQEIQSLLYGWEGSDLTTFGELCAEGAFRVCGAKAQRHVFLFDKILLVTKQKEHATLMYKAHILCSNLMLIESVPGEPLSFHVIPFDNPRQQYTLQARNLEQKREWTLQLKRVILENYNAVIPSHARRLVMELGQQPADDQMIKPRRAHCAPEYLERRCRERDRRRSDGGGLRARLRRVRRSTDALEIESPPSSRRRNRRASSGGRNSESREMLFFDSASKLKERFGSWRRKSEPLCLSRLAIAPDNNSTSSSSITTNSPSIASRTPSTSTTTSTTIRMTTCSSSNQNEINDQESLGEPEENNIEEIVGHLLSQNHEFNKLLNKPHLRRPPRRSQSLMTGVETTDDDEDNDNRVSEGNYDNLQKIWESVHQQQVEWNGVALPTSPAEWLKQQGQHLAVADKKSGSLPRSFGLPYDERPKESRPFTIASDQPSDISLDDFEGYLARLDITPDEEDSCPGRFPTNTTGDTTEDESPGVSMQQLNVHPEHRIYRSSVKAVFSRLTDEDPRGTTRRLYKMARQYSHFFKRRIRNFLDSASSASSSSQPSISPSKEDFPVTYKQGSSSLGARIAHCSEYANPQLLFPHLRPDSLLSVSTNWTSSSDTSNENQQNSQQEQEQPVEKNISNCNINNKSVNNENNEKNTSELDDDDESYYERSFEAIESLMEEEMFRDSAIFSDQEDVAVISKSPPRVKVLPNLPPSSFSTPTTTATTSFHKMKIPPPVPAKPPADTLKKLRIARSNTPRPDECEEPADDNPSGPTRGWVRHVIVKLQGTPGQVQ